MYVHPTIAAQFAAVHVDEMRRQARRARRAREARRARRGPLGGSSAIVSMITGVEQHAQPCVAC